MVPTWWSSPRLSPRPSHLCRTPHERNGDITSRFPAEADTGRRSTQRGLESNPPSKHPFVLQDINQCRKETAWSLTHSSSKSFIAITQLARLSSLIPHQVIYARSSPIEPATACMCTFTFLAYIREKSTRPSTTHARDSKHQTDPCLWKGRARWVISLESRPVP